MLRELQKQSSQKVRGNPLHHHPVTRFGHLFSQWLEDQVCPSTQCYCTLYSGILPNGIMFLYPFLTLKELLSFASPINHPYEKSHKYQHIIQKQADTRKKQLIEFKIFWKNSTYAEWGKSKGKDGRCSKELIFSLKTFSTSLLFNQYQFYNIFLTEKAKYFLKKNQNHKNRYFIRILTVNSFLQCKILISIYLIHLLQYLANYSWIIYFYTMQI